MKTVTLIIPCYNEEQNLLPFYEAITPVLANLSHYQFDLLFIDDGSLDGTSATLATLSQRDPRVRIIELSRNFGKEAALTAGIDDAMGDAAIPMDVDLQDPPELLPEMLKKWEEGAEVVLAHRHDRRSDSFLKRTMARLFYHIHNRLSDVPIPEDVGDFRLLDRQVINALKTLPERQRFMKGLFAWVGFRTSTVDYARPRRIGGTSRFSGWKLWNLALEGITGFSTIPLRVWTYIGGIGAVTTFLYAVFIVLRTLIFGVDLPGYASTLVAILFIGSLQLVSIGLLGEYIGRIYLESKQRPPYLVRRHYGSHHECRPHESTPPKTRPDRANTCSSSDHSDA